MTIVREWSGRVPAGHAEGFHEHLLATGVAEAATVEGFLGATVLRRAEGDDTVRFTLLTRWSGEAAVRRFAGPADEGTDGGPDADAARLYPGDERFGLVPDRRVTHHQLVRSQILSPVRAAYIRAAEASAALLGHPAVAAAWDEPSALDRYAVRGLAGHLAGQIFFAEKSLAEPEPDAGPTTILDYYARVRWMNAGHDDEAHVAIRHGSGLLAADGPAALAERAEAAVARLPRVLASVPERRLVRLASWRWTLTLDDFLLSRMVELTVHLDDLAASVGLPTPPLPAEVTEPVLDLLTRLAVRRHGAGALLRALTRAERAPESVAAM